MFVCLFVLSPSESYNLFYLGASLWSGHLNPSRNREYSRLRLTFVRNGWLLISLAQYSMDYNRHPDIIPFVLGSLWTPFFCLQDSLGFWVSISLPFPMSHLGTAKYFQTQNIIAWVLAKLIELSFFLRFCPLKSW